MFIYNVTVNINDDVHTEWLSWMKEVHMPEVMKTGYFIDCQILKVMSAQDTGNTYSVQYKFLEIEDIENYQNNDAPRLQKEHSEKYKDKFVAFRTVLKVV
jgi:hypothetical protein